MARYRRTANERDGIRIDNPRMLGPNGEKLEMVEALAGYIGVTGEGAFQYVEAQDPEDGGKWKSAAYWARKGRGIRLRNAQIMHGDGTWVDDEAGGRTFVVTGEVGSPWIGGLRHMTRSTYINWECRCRRCCSANEEYGSDYRAGLTGEDESLAG